VQLHESGVVGGRRRRPQLEEQPAAALPGPDLVEAHMPGDAEQPGADGRVTGKPRQGAVCAQEGLLRQVVGSGCVDKCGASTPHVGLGGTHEPGESGKVAADGSAGQLAQLVRGHAITVAVGGRGNRTPSPVDSCGVKCSRIRESLSARLDGEEMALPATVADGHVAGCSACRSWLAAAADVSRRSRLEAPAAPDLVLPVLTAIRAADGSGRPRSSPARILLAALALAQLALAAPVLILGHDHTAPIHVAHELGSFDAALALGLLCSALRPRLSAGMLPLVGAITLLLLVTAGFDIAVGHTDVVEEMPHLLDLVEFLLLLRIAATTPTETRLGRAALGNS
jgi:predicted anti-sigma-YlaC factor YlaD